MVRSGLTYRILGIIVAFALIGAGPTDSPDKAMGEGAVKVTVALIYRSCDFVTWPEDCFSPENNELIIGVFGSNKLAEEMRDATEGREVKGHPIRVVEIEKLAEVPHTHVLFVGDEKVEEFTQYANDEKVNHAILTVSNSAEFMEGGGVLRIYVRNNKPALQINVDAARRQNLALHSQLLKLAEIYREED